ncbi:Gibberellin receptor GID1 [Zea mays]|uniref:Gibberellin receptor GID1 n=2 Tax=Zea mays TaxID=4577 RepID=A0A1D6K3W0_MAIZE|nr:Gibberellin receptor GID1 [Zea mays]ONL98315.1 Gibberellin receptor GID1 [Zea mays]ONM22264.1 Gibberellin receptor GID1 [Zea mays]ONM56583.1 Gibberellin receptor GID1 [Zea mays]
MEAAAVLLRQAKEQSWRRRGSRSGRRRPSGVWKRRGQLEMSPANSRASSPPSPRSSLVEISPANARVRNRVLNPHAAIEPDSKLEFDMPDALRVYKIDCVERFDDTKSVPSSPNGNSTNGVASKDFATGISSRLYLPARVDPEKKLPIVVFFHDGAFMVHNASFPLYHIYIASVDVAVPASR